MLMILFILFIIAKIILPFMLFMLVAKLVLKFCDKHHISTPDPGPYAYISVLSSDSDE